jgi:hypothetical protein
VWVDGTKFRFLRERFSGGGNFDRFAKNIYESLAGTFPSPGIAMTISNKCKKLQNFLLFSTPHRQSTIRAGEIRAGGCLKCALKATDKSIFGAFNFSTL